MSLFIENKIESLVNGAIGALEAVGATMFNGIKLYRFTSASKILLSGYPLQKALARGQNHFQRWCEATFRIM